MKSRMRLVVGLAAALVFATTQTASATSWFQYNVIARPAIVTVNGVTRILTIVGAGQSANWLAWKTPTTDWARVTGGPGSTFGYMTGAVGGTVDATHVAGWGGQAAVYVLGGTTNHVWQYSYSAAGVGSWRDVNGTGGPTLANGATMTAAWIPYAFFDAPNGAFMIATSVYNTGTGVRDLWTCRVVSATSNCIWENETSFGAGPVQWNSPVAIDPSCPGGGEFSVYSVTNAGWLQRFLWVGVDIDSSRPAAPVTVDTTGIQVFSVGTSCYAAVAGINGITYDDTLQLARTTGLSSWTWTDLSTGTSLPTISWQSGNIAYSTYGATRLLWVLASGPSPTSMWQCSLSLSGTPSCGWANRGHPADEVNSVLGWGTAAVSNSIYVTGRVGNTASYLFEWSGNGAEWHDHLTYRDYAVQFPVSPAGTSVGEFVADEYDGTVLYGAIAGTGGIFTWSSTDDGSTVQQIANPLTLAAGDPNVVFDAGGTAYLSALSVSPFSVMITRWTSPTTWSTPWAINPASGIASDRPWLAADRTMPGRLYLAWSRSPTIGAFAYCNGSADCASAPTAWCPADNTAVNQYVLPSSTGCLGQTGCWVDTDGAGHIWITVADDTACTANPYSAHSRAASIGIHRISAPLGTPCMSAPAFATLMASSLTECVYYVRDAWNPGTQCNGGALSPCANRRWDTAMSATRDSSGVISLALQAYRDVPGGGPCLDTSVACRSDRLFLYRSPSAGWCGSSCSWTPNMSNMLLVNSDQSPLRQEDHVVPALVSLDYGRFATSWVDFRSTGPLPNRTTFTIASAFIRTGSPLTVVETVSWPGSAGTFQPGIFHGVPPYGDINQPVQARLHTHLVASTTPAAVAIGLTAVQSPVTGP